MHWIDRIEAEFGEPITDVLQGFADMGYGCNTTARMLDYDAGNFRRLLKRHGIAIRWPNSESRIDAYERNPWPGCKAMIRARRKLCRNYTHPETSESLTATEWAKRLGISVSWFMRRYQKYGDSKRSYQSSMRRAA